MAGFLAQAFRGGLRAGRALAPRVRAGPGAEAPARRPPAAAPHLPGPTTHPRHPV